VSERRNHLVLVGLILAALVGALALIVPASPVHKEPILGLDLQGGLEVILKAEPERGVQIGEAGLDRSVEIIRERIDKLGVSEPEVQKQGEDEIAVRLPGVRNAEQAREVIGTTAKLELYDMGTALTGPSVDPRTFDAVPSPSLYALLSAPQTTAVVGDGAGPFYLYSKPVEPEAEPAEGEAQEGEEAQQEDENESESQAEEQPEKRLAGPYPTRKALLATDAAKEILEDGKVPDTHQVLAVPQETVVLTCGQSADFCPGIGPPSQIYYYLFKFTPEAEELEDRFPQMTGDDLRLSGTRQDFDPQTGEAIVTMSFTDAGADKFGRVTRIEAERGRRLYNQAGGAGEPDLYNQSFAIVLDREIRSFPSIDFETYPTGIGGSGGAQITGLGSADEAKNLALVLQTGALPVEFVTLSETQISATLGEDSLQQALEAGLAAMVIVALFLLIAYRFLGLVAVFGLAIYAVFLYAALLVFNVTLTLPGFAGMILTIGVAADANIVVFERIKEESRAGKSVRAAVSAGYAKGFSTILDANAVTAITALVLFTLATAGVRGFALLLLMGTAISLITAVFATRAMLGLLAGFRWFDSPKFMGAAGNQIASWIQHDYVGKRRIWFAISGVVVAFAVGALALKGLNLGIEFEGGSRVTFTTEEPVTIEEVREQAATVGQEGAVIQGVGDALPGERYREFQLRAENLDGAETTQLQNALDREIGLVEAEGQPAFNVTTVSASFGVQIARSAVYAILFSLLLVVVYITLRFQWKFAAATIIALLHDVLIAVGIYALLGREVSTSTVAAILTVLGYSIYDTIIILDRVRENVPLMRRASFPTIANVSLWETIRRSLATTFITLLPITALYLFGGETLKDFAFALLVGIGSGAYSSIFIAAPLLSLLKEREYEWIQRQDVFDVSKDGAGPLLEAEAAAADKPVPVLAPLTTGERVRTNEAKRERRRQRRRARPHGRAR
jgi:SecD/SecF fusion protein